MHTKIRVRGEAPYTEIGMFPTMEGHYQHGNRPSTVTFDLPATLRPFTLVYSESTIQDEVIDFSQYPKSEHKALKKMITDPKSIWRRAFKYCHNYTKWYNTVVTPAPYSIPYSLPNSWLSKYYWYWLNDSSNMAKQCYDYFRGDPIATYLNNSVVQEITGVADWQLAEFVEECQEDAALLGLATFSIANFIAELKELKSLVDVFKFKMSKPIESAASQNLTWQFGVFPFLGDVAAIYDIMMNLDHKIQAWNDMAENGIVMNQHKTHQTGEDVATNYSFRQNDPWGGTFAYSWYHSDIVSRTKYHLYYKPLVLPKMEENSLLRALLGLDNIGSIIWEALPWSFLIDYVYNVGDLVESWTNADPVLRIDISTFGYSRKLILSNFVQDAYTNGQGYPYIDMRDLNWLTFSREGHYDSYERVEREVSSLPATTERSVGEFQLGDFDGRKATIVASLGVLYRK